MNWFNLIYCLILLFILGGEIYQVVYWWNNDTMTLLQLFKHFIWLNIAQIVGVLFLWVLGEIVDD